MVRRLDEYRDRPRQGQFLVFVALALLLLFPYFEKTRNANELPRLVQAMALVDTGRAAIDGPARRRLDLGPDVSRSPVDGRLYPNKPPGTSLAIVPAYAIARALRGDQLDLRTYTWWARLFSGVLPTLVLAAFLARRLAWLHSRGPALAAVSLWLFATPALSYAKLAYGHALAACLLAIGVAWTVQAAVAPPAFRGQSVRRGLAGGLLAGAAVGVEYGAVLAGLPLACFLLARLRVPAARPAVLASLAGACLPVFGLALYHDAVFGSPWATGYHFAEHPAFAAAHAEGLLGLGWPAWPNVKAHLLQPSSGLLWWVPALVFAVWGLVHGARHPDEPSRSQSRVHLAIVGVYVLALTGLGFEGGWRVGPRYFVVVLPLLTLGWAEAAAQLRNRAIGIVLLVALATYGSVMNVMAANLWPHMDPEHLAHPLPDLLWPLWEAGVAPQGPLWWWGRIELTHAILVATVVGAMIALARALEPMPRTIFAFAAGVALGLGGCAAALAWPRHPAAPRNLAYVLEVWEPAADAIGLPTSRTLPRLDPEAVERARKGPVSPATAKPEPRLQWRRSPD